MFVDFAYIHAKDGASTETLYVWGCQIRCTANVIPSSGDGCSADPGALPVSPANLCQFNWVPSYEKCAFTKN